MKNNKWKLIGFICMCFNIILIATSLAILPNKVPVHFGFDENADRYGSKFELLLFPIIVIFLWLIMNYMAKKRLNNEKTIYVINAIIMLFFIPLEIFIVCLMKDEPKEINIDSLFKIVTISIGALFVLLGNLSPKIKKNAFLGIRTKYSLYNENTWFKTHRFGGYYMVATGIVMIILSIFIPGFYNLIMLLVLLIALLIVVTVYSYKVYQEEINKLE